MNTSDLRASTCCFTGHRILPAHKVREIATLTARQIRSLIIKNNVQFFGVGGAIGYDTLVAELLFQLKEKEYPHIKIILVYPFDGFTSRWTPEQKATYRRLLCKYDKVVCVSKTADREAYFARNRHLVDASAYCISYCTRNYGGTAYTVRYAKRQGLEICNISGNRI